MASNSSTESYDGKQLQYWILWWQATPVLNPMMASNYDGSSTESYDGKQLQYWILWW